MPDTISERDRKTQVKFILFSTLAIFIALFVLNIIFPNLAIAGIKGLKAGVVLFIAGVAIITVFRFMFAGKEIELGDAIVMLLPLTILIIVLTFFPQVLPTSLKIMVEPAILQFQSIATQYGLMG